MVAGTNTATLGWKLDACVTLLARLVELAEARAAADEAMAATLTAMRQEMQPQPEAVPEWRIEAGRYLVLDGGAWRSATAAESALIQATHAAPRRR